ARAAGMGLPSVALIFLLITTVLLVADLKRPARFHYILLKSNPRSWLVWGGWILMAFGAVLALWLWAGLAGRPAARGILVVPLVALALAAAGYSAFLFAQAEGRDAWQSALVLPHLLVSALTAGAAGAVLPVGPGPPAPGCALGAPRGAPLRPPSAPGT